jgi:hypothetical protein
MDNTYVKVVVGTISMSKNKKNCKKFPKIREFCCKNGLHANALHSTCHFVISPSFYDNLVDKKPGAGGGSPYKKMSNSYFFATLYQNSPKSGEK